jgi:hypothetical protein
MSDDEIVAKISAASDYGVEFVDIQLPRNLLPIYWKPSPLRLMQWRRAQ